MKQPAKFVLYAVLDKEDNDEVVAVALSRQKAKYIIVEDLLRFQGETSEVARYKVRRAKGVLFDT